MSASVTEDSRFAGLFEVFVGPFYLDMMRHNATRAKDSMLDRVVRAAGVVSVNDVVHLLRGSWRFQVMGAWYALAHPGDPVVRAEVLQTLAQRCAGSLTAPALAVAAIVLAGADAVPALTQHVERNARDDDSDGSPGLCAAAVEFVRGYGSRTLPRPTDLDRERLSALLHVAARFVSPIVDWPLLSPAGPGRG